MQSRQHQSSQKYKKYVIIKKLSHSVLRFEHAGSSSDKWTTLICHFLYLHAGDQRSHDLIQYYHNNTPTNNPKQKQYI